MENNLLPDEIQGTYPGQALVRVEQSRAVQEVQGQMYLAKTFPRKILEAEAKILKECERKSLAETALYSYPRGGTTIEGPSIRLAEVIARNYGNIMYGLTELSQNNGESEVEAYAFDLETNTRASRKFVVKHIRQKRSGNVELVDPRDIYEMVANQGQRRVRAVILEIIPADIVDKAVAQCNKTLKGAYSEPLEDRIVNMVRAFDKLGVPQSAIERRLNHVVDVTTETEIASLIKIHSSIKDGMSKREDWFDISSGQAETVRDRISKSQERRVEVQKKAHLDQQITRTDITAPEISETNDGEEPPKDAFLKKLNFQKAGNGNTTGLVKFLVDNQELIEADETLWIPVYDKFVKTYGTDKNPPFYLPSFDAIEEPTEEQLEEQPDAPDRMYTSDTGVPLVNFPGKSEDTQEMEMPDLSTHAGFQSAMVALADRNREVYWAVLREKGFNKGLGHVGEKDREPLYRAMLDSMKDAENG